MLNLSANQRVFHSIGGESVIIVTGMYGGTDWGPTDAWLTRGDRTVLICTYEKAEALMRFLGPFFLPRVSLVVIDEAHAIEFSGNVASLISGEARELRLESLAMRLLAHTDDAKVRFIALSAVAAEASNAIVRWTRLCLKSAFCPKSRASAQKVLLVIIESQVHLLLNALSWKCLCK